LEERKNENRREKEQGCENCVEMDNKKINGKIIYSENKM
jgi:hypothetical protein